MYSRVLPYDVYLSGLHILLNPDVRGQGLEGTVKIHAGGSNPLCINVKLPGGSGVWTKGVREWRHDGSSGLVGMHRQAHGNYLLLSRERITSVT